MGRTILLTVLGLLGSTAIGTGWGDPQDDGARKKFGEDPAVDQSIAVHFKVGLSATAQRDEIQVDVEKPLDKAFYVDQLRRSSIIHVNGRPWVLSRPELGEDCREYLRPTLGSFHCVLRLPAALPGGSEVSVEWLNYNHRTKTLERLVTDSMKVK